MKTAAQSSMDPGGVPPEESYSRLSNLERFAPIHSVAEALIAWLEGTFDVTVYRTEAAAADLLRVPEGIVSAVRIAPNDPSAAPLTFVLTSVPGLYVHAGALHDFLFPVCGCDACDEEIISVADELEWTVHRVVGGGYTEQFESWPSRWLGYRLNEPGVAMRAGRSRVKDLSDHRPTMARRILPKTGQWAPWPSPGEPSKPSYQRVS